MLEKIIGKEGYVVCDNETIIAQGKTMPDLVSNLKRYTKDNGNIGIYYGVPSRKDLSEQVSNEEIKEFRKLYFA